MNAIGACGLQLYRFGETISIPFFTDTWRPDSFYDKIKRNRSMGLHTLCLLDIRVKEPSVEAMARGKVVYEPPRYMSVNCAAAQLLEVEEKRNEGAYLPSSYCVGVARIGTATELIISGQLSELTEVDFGPPLHSLVIPGDLHVIETESLDTFRLNDSTRRVEVREEDLDDGEGESNIGNL
eukprot:TRINITY_DN13020_c0_g1_i2.p1 TRINITY_DN13020_c0_g1~~TRINITY_DN13020_c0_g1_i2.p1  ORF type:complete len:181 (-),score=22.41 TRINITY_DN13020_c0_g1_i2:53-595(-)